MRNRDTQRTQRRTSSTIHPLVPLPTGEGLRPTVKSPSFAQTTLRILGSQPKWGCKFLLRCVSFDPEQVIWRVLRHILVFLVLVLPKLEQKTLFWRAFLAGASRSSSKVRIVNHDALSITCTSPVNQAACLIIKNVRGSIVILISIPICIIKYHVAGVYKVLVRSRMHRQPHVLANVSAARALGRAALVPLVAQVVGHTLRSVAQALGHA